MIDEEVKVNGCFFIAMIVMFSLLLIYIGNCEAEPVYNYMEEEYEMVENPDDMELKYNYMEDVYTYEYPNAQLEYNYMEDEYEYER